jgi:putative ABC transport system permease protein
VYYILSEGANVTDITKRLNEVVKANRPDDAIPSHFRLQPLTDIHFYSANITGAGNGRQGEISYVYIFGAVGLFLLIIACVNYINLSTAFAITRGKEIGIKKVAGAHRNNLIAQFITESTFIAFVSVLLALVFVNVLLPQFNEFTGKTIELTLLFQLPSILMLAGFTLLLGFLSGFYPAFYLSKLKPAMALKGFSKGQGSAWLRKGLVVFQFTLSIMLIIASITAYRQIQFIRSKNLGFNQEQLVMLDINSGKVRRGAETIKTELLRLPAAKSVTVSSRVPGEWKNLLQVRIATTDQPEGVHHYMIGADEDFLSTFEISLVKGRNFLPGRSDSLSVLINETAANLLGITEPGYQVSIPAVNYGASDEPLEKPFYARVIGIVGDFHFQSLHQKIAPMVITHSTNPIQSIDYFTVRLNPGDMETTLKAMEKIFATVDTDHPLEYNFLDDRLADFYQEDLKRGKLFGISAIVSISIACLGLFSLASFNTEQRTKEIGIRKVLGASLGQITLLLSGNYIKLVAVGFLIAAPLSFWALREWLASFAYRIQIDAWILALAGILSVIIALLTVSYKSIRAALADPVDSLRNE